MNRPLYENKNVKEDEVTANMNTKETSEVVKYVEESNRTRM